MKQRRSRKAARLRVGILVALGAGAVVSALAAVLLGTQTWDDLLLDLATGLAGSIVTYLLIERLVGATERREPTRADLIARMRSQVMDAAMAATEEVRRHGWVTDGSLPKVRRSGGNLADALLFDADLAGANLGGSSLADATLFSANLTGADLGSADLSGARLLDADMTGASLINANLTGAILLRANLTGACLKAARLTDATLYAADLNGAEVTTEQLAQAKSLKGATMPDGRRFEGTMKEFPEWVAQGAGQNGDGEL